MSRAGPGQREGTRRRLLLVLVLFLAVYGLLCYYVGKRGYGYLLWLYPGFDGWVYWSLFWLVAGSFFIGMWLKGTVPQWIAVFFSRLGAYWLAALVYLALLLPWFPPARPGLALAAGCLTAGLLVYGTQNARRPRVVRYQVDLPGGSGAESLRVAMVSDLHLGSEVGLDRLDRLVEMVNGLNPDLVLLVGDIIEQDFDTLPRAAVIESFGRLSPRLGTFAVLGNHDYYSGMAEELVEDLLAGGVVVMRDEVTRVADLLYLVGRDDRQRYYSSGIPRRPLAELMAEVEPRLPVILLDHQPYQLPEAESLGVDLMLGGHTHRGQMFPFNFVTGRIFEVDWGYLRRGELQVIVSCGYGTWGPPVRLGNHPEVVDLHLRLLGPDGE